MSDDQVLNGSCACGVIAFTLSGEKRDAVGCHCVSCRKQSGHFVAATRVLSANLSITRGKTHLSWWSATDEAKRGFCDTCGSLLFWQRAGSDHISVFAGSLDGETGLTLTHHIHTGEKGDYYEIADGLPTYEGRD